MNNKSGENLTNEAQPLYYVLVIYSQTNLPACDPRTVGSFERFATLFLLTNEKGRTNLGQVDECATIEDFARFIGENVFKIQSKSGEKKSWFARILNFFKK